MRRAFNTLRHQVADLTIFVTYLEAVKFYPPIAEEDERKERGLRLFNEPEAWRAITYGLVAGFARWQLQQGYALGSINVQLSTVRKYTKLAFQASVLSAEQVALIKHFRRLSVQRAAAA